MKTNMRKSNNQNAVQYILYTSCVLLKKGVQKKNKPACSEERELKTKKPNFGSSVRMKN